MACTVLLHPGIATGTHCLPFLRMLSTMKPSQRQWLTFDQNIGNVGSNKPVMIQSSGHIRQQQCNCTHHQVQEQQPLWHQHNQVQHHHMHMTLFFFSIALDDLCCCGLFCLNKPTHLNACAQNAHPMALWLTHLLIQAQHKGNHTLTS